VKSDSKNFEGSTPSTLACPFWKSLDVFSRSNYSAQVS
jgi:hypothetical protein